MEKKKLPTPRQKKAAKAVVENALSDKPTSTGQVLKNVGYGTGLQDQPKRVLESEGFKVALGEIGLKKALQNAGIDSKKIAEKIDVLLNAGKENADGKKEDDYTAIDKGLKHATAIYGIDQDGEKKPKGNIYNFFINNEAQQKVRDMNEDIKEILTRKKDV